MLKHCFPFPISLSPVTPLHGSVSVRIPSVISSIPGSLHLCSVAVLNSSLVLASVTSFLTLNPQALTSIPSPWQNYLWLSSESLVAKTKDWSSLAGKH